MSILADTVMVVVVGVIYSKGWASIKTEDVDVVEE